MNRFVSLLLEKDSLTKDEALNCGQQIMSQNQAYRCVMQVTINTLVFNKILYFFQFAHLFQNAFCQVGKTLIQVSNAISGGYAPHKFQTVIKSTRTAIVGQLCG